MNVANIALGNTPRLSTGDLIEQARVIKSLMASGDERGLVFDEIFGPGSMNDSEALDEIRHVKGWNWTAILAKSLQFVMADISVFVRKDLAQEIRAYDPVINRSADQTQLQSQDIPASYEVAPDAYLIRKLLDQPNPWTSQEHFKFDMGMQYSTHGVCHILVIPDRNGYPAQMFVIPKAMIHPQAPTRRMPEGSFRIGRLNRYFNNFDPQIEQDDFQPQTLHEAYSWLSDRDYPSRYIISIGIPSLLWRDDHSSPSRAMAGTLMVDDAIQESRKATMKSQQSRGPVLREKDGVSLSPDQREEYMARYERSSHGINTEGAPRWASDLFDVDNPLDTAREMEYTEGSIESRDSILGQNMVPPSIVGLGDSAGFAAVIGSAKQWATFCGQPTMDLMAGQLTTGLRSFFEKPKDEFLIKIQTSRIDDDQVEETKLMNDLSAGAITVGEWRDLRRRKRFGDERDDQIAGQGGSMGQQMDGAAAASYGDDLGDDTESDVATPGVGAAVQDDPAASTKGEMSSLSRLQFGRNRKGIEEQLERYANGELKRPVAFQFLLMLGCSEDRANSLLDAVSPEPVVKTDETEQQDEAMLQPSSVTKAFGTPVQSGLPYIVSYLPDDLRNAVEDWKLFINGGEYSDPGVPHVTLYGPVLDSSPKTLQQMQEIFAKPNLPSEVVLGKLKVFRNADQHVLVIEAQSHGLAALHRALQGTVRSPLASHSLNLHVTMAYGEPGAFDQYDGSSLGGITGHRYLVSEVVFGTREQEIARYEIRKPEVLLPASSGITYAVPAVKSVLGMGTIDGESGGFVADEQDIPELKSTGQWMKVAGQTLEVFIDKDGNRWVTLENEVRVQIDGQGNVLAGPPGMASVKPGAKKKPTADVADARTTPSGEMQPAAGDSSTSTADTIDEPPKQKKPRVAKIKDPSPTDMKLSNNDFFMQSYKKAERHLDSRRSNALNAVDAQYEEYTSTRLKRIESEMKADSLAYELAQAKGRDPRRSYELQTELDTVRKQVLVSREQEKQQQEKLHNDFRAQLGITPATERIRNASSQQAAAQSKDAIDEGVSVMRSWASDDVVKNIRLSTMTTVEGNQRLSVHGDDGSRSYAFKGPEGGQGIAIAPGANASVMAHELGHVIEFSDPKVQKLAQGFLVKRTASEEPVEMNSKFPNSGYDPSERGKKDDFEAVFDESSAYYIGKYYKDGSTEVVSMGLQQLHRDPIKFAENDPEYFNLMVGILQGTLK
jgi:hypothetical protein